MCFVQYRRNVETVGPDDGLAPAESLPLPRRAVDDDAEAVSLVVVRRFKLDLRMEQRGRESEFFVSAMIAC